MRKNRGEAEHRVTFFVRSGDSGGELTFECVVIRGLFQITAEEPTSKDLSRCRPPFVQVADYPLGTVGNFPPERVWPTCGNTLRGHVDGNWTSAGG